MRKIVFAIIIASMCFSTGANAQSSKKKSKKEKVTVQPLDVTNDSVLTLLGQGRTSEEIISNIEKSPKLAITYSLKYMRQLKQAGADETLTTYIQKICKADNTYEGFYWWNKDGKPLEVNYTAYKKKKSLKLGKAALGAMTGGVAYVASKAISKGVDIASGKKVKYMIAKDKDFESIYMPGKTSTDVVETYTPVFRLYLPNHDRENFEKQDDADWYKTVMKQIHSADEFQLVKIRSKGDRRFFESGCKWEMGSFEGKSYKHKYVIDCEINQINDNTFEIIPQKPLKRGEYVFFWRNCIGCPTFQQNVFGFDFTVPKVKKTKVKK